MLTCVLFTWTTAEVSLERGLADLDLLSQHGRARRDSFPTRLFDLYISQLWNNSILYLTKTYSGTCGTDPAVLGSPRRWPHENLLLLPRFVFRVLEAGLPKTKPRCGAPRRRERWPLLPMCLFPPKVEELANQTFTYRSSLLSPFLRMEWTKINKNKKNSIIASAAGRLEKETEVRIFEFPIGWLDWQPFQIPIYSTEISRLNLIFSGGVISQRVFFKSLSPYGIANCCLSQSLLTSLGLGFRACRSV